MREEDNLDISGDPEAPSLAVWVRWPDQKWLAPANYHNLFSSSCWSICNSRGMVSQNKQPASSWVPMSSFLPVCWGHIFHSAECYSNSTPLLHSAVTVFKMLELPAFSYCSSAIWHEHINLTVWEIHIYISSQIRGAHDLQPSLHAPSWDKWLQPPQTGLTTQVD